MPTYRVSAAVTREEEFIVDADSAENAKFITLHQWYKVEDGSELTVTSVEEETDAAARLAGGACRVPTAQEAAAVARSVLETAQADTLLEHLPPA